MQIIKEEVAQAMGEPEDTESAADDMFADMEDTTNDVGEDKPVEPVPEEDEVVPAASIGEEDDTDTEEMDAGGEAVDHEAIADTTAAASKMLSSVEDFEENATPDMQNAISSEISALKEKLLDMVMNAEKFAKRRNLEPKTK